MHLFTEIICIQAKCKTTSDPITDERKAEIVSVGLCENSWRVAAKRYGVSAKSVAMWAKKSEKKLKFFADKVDRNAKRKILKYGLVHNSWKIAARKFAIPMSAISSWAKKDGLKLRFLKTKRDKCVVCKLVLGKNETLDEHIAGSHITNTGNCNFCGTTSADLVGSTSEDLIDHFYDHILDM